MTDGCSRNVYFRRGKYNNATIWLQSISRYATAPLQTREPYNKLNKFTVSDYNKLNKFTYSGAAATVDVCIKAVLIFSV